MIMIVNKPQCIEIFRLGSLPFTEDQEVFLDLRVATLRRSGLSPSVRLDSSASVITSWRKGSSRSGPAREVDSIPAGGSMGATDTRHTRGRARFARISALGYAGGIGLGSSLGNPKYGMIQIIALLAAAILVLTIAVCLPEQRSERLYRWGRLLLGRSEPPTPEVQLPP